MLPACHSQSTLLLHHAYAFMHMHSMVMSLLTNMMLHHWKKLQNFWQLFTYCSVTKGRKPLHTKLQSGNANSFMPNFHLQLSTGYNGTQNCVRWSLTSKWSKHSCLTSAERQQHRWEKRDDEPVLWGGCFNEDRNEHLVISQSSDWQTKAVRYWW